MDLQRLHAPPRDVHPLVTWQMKLGGPMSQVGWLIFGFGSIFFWMFAWKADLSGWRFFAKTGRVSAEVVDCRDTKYYIGGSRGSRGTPVYANRYQYLVKGEPLTGVSYATGECVSSGSRVMVEYLLAQPNYSRIIGMRHGLLSPWALLAIVFPAAGLASVIAGLRSGALRAYLLREGIAVRGRLTGKEMTNTRINGKVLYRVYVQYRAHDGETRQTMAKTTTPELLADDARELVLYDPLNPDRAVPIDALPGSLALDDLGNFQIAGRKGFLILPGLAVLCNAVFIVRNLTR
jgi:hypothetical protein